MDRPAVSETHASLLMRLRDPSDQSAWRDFVSRYGGRIFAWCRRWGCQEADAEDVTQTVLLTLAEHMRQFTYDPSGSFRAWLKTVTRRAWAKYAEKQGRPGRGPAAATPSRRSSRSRPATTSSAGSRRSSTASCSTWRCSASPSVEPHTWQAFQLTALDGLSGAEAAARLGLSVGAVYVARGLVQKAVQDEIRRVDGGPEA